MSLSKEEREHLSNLLKNYIAEDKASQLGTKASDVIRKVVDGRATWVDRIEAYTQLEKQRAFVTPKQHSKISRSLRGENSLVSKINHQIQVCREWLVHFRQYEEIAAVQRRDLLNSLDHLKERTLRMTTDLIQVEDTIEKIKHEDVIFSQTETLLTELHHAKTAGDHEKTSELLSQNQDLLKKYESRRRKLKPHIMSARHLRYEVQKEYWRSLQLRWKIQVLAFHSEVHRLTKLKETYKAEKLDRIFMSGKGDVRKLHEALQQSLSRMSEQCPESNEDLEAVIQTYDRICRSGDHSGARVELIYHLNDDLPVVPSLINVL